MPCEIGHSITKEGGVSGSNKPACQCPGDRKGRALWCRLRTHKQVSGFLINHK